MIHETSGDMMAVVVIVLNCGSYVRSKLQIWQISKVPYTVKYWFKTFFGGMGGSGFEH
jgi:hypothetical protein